MFPFTLLNHDVTTEFTPTLDAHPLAHYFDRTVKYSQPYRDSVAIQRRIMQVIDTVETKEIANLAKSFATLETLKLRLRMKPAPKAVDVSKLQPKSKKQVVVQPSED